MDISQAAFDLVVDEEVSSRAVYEKRYRHPEWPGGASGVTWGIGYDGGQSSRATIVGDWTHKEADDEVSAMAECAGITGNAARSFLPQVRNRIDVSWDVAIDVFSNHDVPKYVGLVRSHLPNIELLSPDCLGALFSLVYNRGPSFEMASDRYREMRAIKVHMAAKEFAKIPAEFRSMKRLWNNGLVGRREREAILFERGLAGSPVTAPPPRPPAPKPGTVTSTGGTIAAGASTGNLRYFLIAIVVAIVVGGVIYFLESRHKRLGKADPPLPQPTGATA